MAGNMVTECISFPYGEGYSCAGTTPPTLYTGKDRDPETGFDSFGARYYSSSMGRFTSDAPVTSGHEGLCARLALTSNSIMKTLNAADLSPQQNYKLLSGSILPRPIAFVSTMDERGVRNLAPYSFFTVASANPPIVVFCPMVRPPNEKGLSSTKDTLHNIAVTKEFVLNIVSEDFVGKMNETAAEVGPEVDEWKLSGLTPVASELVKPPRVGESRMQMECRLVQLVIASDKPLGGTLVLGEVLRFHVSDEVVNDQLNIDPEKLNAVGRMAGAAYTRTRDRFDLERPKV